MIYGYKKLNPNLQNIDHIHVFVSDRQKALNWYNNIFLQDAQQYNLR